VRQLVTADLPEEVVRDQANKKRSWENRLVPIEVSVLAVGCGEDDAIRHCLPSQPPVTLDWLHQCDSQEVIAFTRQFDYFRLVLEARDVPADELLGSSLQMAAEARAVPEREGFLVEAGRELARLLSRDWQQLDGMLRRIGNQLD
jgi:hypothetical protein